MAALVIDGNILSQALGLRVPAGVAFPGLGLAGLDYETPYLTFLDDAKYLARVNGDPKVAGAFVRQEVSAGLRVGIVPLVVDDPRWAFYTLQNFMTDGMRHAVSSIAETAKIDPTAVVSGEGVRIGANTVVEPRAVILSGTEIGSDCLIRSGAVIGVDGFEHKRTSKGVLSVKHDGVVIIGDRVEIGPNNFVAKGFSYRNTLIGDDSKFDALVHFAHGAQCGRECFFAANAMIAGSASLGDGVWVGPSASVSNAIRVGDRAHLTIGAVVVSDVEPGAKVSGNFAVPHYAFIRHIRKIMGPRKD